MRRISLLLLGVAAASCTMASSQPQPLRSAQKQAEYDRLLAGKVAGPPRSCLPHYNTNDMYVIDESTVAFRAGSSRVYVNHMQGGCSNLGVGGGYALVTKQYGSAELCRGDIGQVVDLHNNFTVGSCVFGDFIPYVKPGVRAY